LASDPPDLSFSSSETSTGNALPVPIGSGFLADPSEQGSARSFQFNSNIYKVRWQAQAPAAPIQAWSRGGQAFSLPLS
jgi:hypothetical protein